MTLGDYLTLSMLALLGIEYYVQQRVVCKHLSALAAKMDALTLARPSEPAQPVVTAAPPEASTPAASISPVVREAMADPVFREEVRSHGRALLRKRLAERAAAAKAAAKTTE